MREETLNKFIPSRMLNQGGRTLIAIRHHFLDGMDSKECAKLAGISKAAASVAITRIRENVLKAGYRKFTDYRKA